jgi:phosphotransferase system HPr-like phosphotransfer protein
MVKNFVEAIEKNSVKMELVSGRYVINAKSIMGIFSLDLTRPIMLRAYSETLPEEVIPFIA